MNFPYACHLHNFFCCHLFEETRTSYYVMSSKKQDMGSSYSKLSSLLLMTYLTDKKLHAAVSFISSALWQLCGNL
jgi:hypothetical protein